MSYRLRKNEPVAEGVKRLAVEQIDHARGQLAQKGDTEKAIHEARKDLKKTRALSGLAGYASEDRRLRNIGRALSEIRDAAVMIEIFDALIEKGQPAVNKERFAGIRRGLLESIRSADAEKAVASALAGLDAARGRLKRWPIEGDEFEALADRFEISYRRGRKTLDRARKNCLAQNLHDLRKRVKEHWYHMRLLENWWTGPLESRTSSLKDLETWLGDHHNLAVLQEKLEKDPERFGDSEGIKLFAPLAASEQQELARNAISLGLRLYEQKPKQFVRELSKLWEAGPAKKQPGKIALRKAKTA